MTTKRQDSVPPADLNEPLLSDDEAARYLGLNPRTLRNWRSLGGGPPYVKVGRYVRYEPRALAAWVKQQTVGAA